MVIWVDSKMIDSRKFYAMKAYSRKTESRKVYSKKADPIKTLRKSESMNTLGSFTLERLNLERYDSMEVDLLFKKE